MMRLDATDPPGKPDRPAPEENSTARQAKLRAFATVIAATVLFLLLVGAVTAVVTAGLAHAVPATPRAGAALDITCSAIGELLVLVLLIGYLRSRHRSLHDLGFGRSAPWYAWLFAAALTAAFVWLTVAGALRGRVAWGEISVFRIYGALTAGIVAGVVEETFFRGFIMSELKWAGCGTLTQATASALLFGVAHTGWGFISGAADWRLLIGSTVFTAIIGLGYAIAYLAGRRSLMPVVAGHLVMDALIEPWLVLSALSAAVTHLH